MNVRLALFAIILAIGHGICLRIAPASAAEGLPMQYHKSGVISGEGSGTTQFSDELRGLAVDSADRLYAVGDTKIAIFSATGDFLKSWPTAAPGHCVAIAADGTIYVGEEGQIERFDANGKLRDTWRDPEHLGLITAIGFAGDSILVGDASARCIRRLDRGGRFLSDIGKDNRLGGFQIPNGQVDFAVDASGIISVTNPGRHRVERYSLDGKLLGTFGRFDGQDPAGFTGCCNPTNLALTTSGNLVTAEKASPRVKIYDAAGKLLALMGTQDFDPNCVNMDIAVDSRGRIYVADTVRLQIVVFEPDSPPSASQPATGRGQGAEGPRGRVATSSQTASASAPAGVEVKP